MSLKILYDYQIFDQHFGGISNVFSKRIDAIKKSQNIEVSLPIKYHNNFHLSELGVSVASDNLSQNFLRKIIGKKKFRKYTKNYNQKLSINALDEQNFDIFHPTYYDPYFLDKIKDKPFVIDIHDMTPEIFPEFFNSKNKDSFNKKILTQKATKIIVVSQNTKKDLIDIFDIDENKIEIIYHGNNFENIKIDEIKNQEFEEKLPQKYLLFVGNRSGYKNFYFFLTAIRKILSQDRDLKLLCVGPSFSNSEIDFIKNLDLENKVINYSNIGDNYSMALIYKNAELFVFPSLYEGFGLPILEAFACGCAVAASNISSIPEIGQEGAIYFEPKNYDSIKDTIEKILYDKKLRAILIKHGFERLKNFSWQNSINQTAELYKRIV